MMKFSKKLPSRETKRYGNVYHKLNGISPPFQESFILILKILSN